MNKTFTTVYVLCGVFNHIEFTQNILKCLFKQSYAYIQVIIIDDGSSDGTYQFIKENYPNVKILKGTGDLWWTGSMYWGVEEVLKVGKKGDFILTINNDCIFNSSYVQSLVNSSKKFKHAIVGSLAVDKNNKNNIYDAGMRIDWKYGKWITLEPHLFNQLNGRLYQENIDILSTKGTLYPLEVFHKIGNFDKKHFPHYLSDYEFSYRAKKNGFKLVLSYRSIVYNDIERTGLWQHKKKTVGLKEAWNLLFSRRSKVNIIDNLKFIKYCCPKEYRMRNYWFLIKKILNFGLHYLTE